jgi:hypothetical protein
MISRAPSRARPCAAAVRTRTSPLSGFARGGSTQGIIRCWVWPWYSKDGEKPDDLGCAPRLGGQLQVAEQGGGEGKKPTVDPRQYAAHRLHAAMRKSPLAAMEKSPPSN